MDHARVSYYRRGGRSSGVAECEWLSVDRDEFHAWRSLGAAAVGRFGGTLTADEAARLKAAVAACEAAEPAHPSVAMRDASTVQVDIDSTSVSYGSGSPPAGPWTKLDQVLRDLCDAIVDRPTAAIGVEDTGDGTALVHRGRDPIDVDLTDGTFVAIALSGWFHEEGRSEGALEGGRVTAEPGWSAPIPIGDLPGGDVKVHVITHFTLGAGRDATPVEAALTPELERPE